MFNYHFKSNCLFSLARRLRGIMRWSLMHNLKPENVAEHSHEVSIFAHGIAVVGVNQFERTYNPERIAVIGIYHELSESITGDIPSTLKHASKDTSALFGKIEGEVVTGIVNSLDNSTRSHMATLVCDEHISTIERDIVKAADILSMILKCNLELTLNNKEFAPALEKNMQQFKRYLDSYPEVRHFFDMYMKESQQTIDGLVSL